MAMSIGATQFVRCVEVVHILVSQLWEVPLYHCGTRAFVNDFTLTCVCHLNEGLPFARYNILIQIALIKCFEILQVKQNLCYILCSVHVLLVECKSKVHWLEQ